MTVLDAPKSNLTQEYKARRSRLLSQCKVNSIVVVASASEQTRSRDTEYPFRQNSDFYYLTGFNEPDALLVLSNGLGANNFEKAIVFVRPKNKTKEIWQGRRLGVIDAPKSLNIDIAYSIDDIDEILVDLVDGHEHLYIIEGNELSLDHHVKKAMQKCRQAPKQSKQAPTVTIDLSPLIHEMRLVKSDAEIELMQRSVDISVGAHIKTMRQCKPDMFEYQLEAIILHHFAMNGARHPAYNTIVGGGKNACILHYTENAEQLNSGDLVLIDAGSEYLGYAADLTRTFPVNGRFSVAQSKLYNIVLSAQLASIEACKPGVTISELMQVSARCITKGLVELGILVGSVDKLVKNEDYKAFYMHGLGHYLGLDVHDVGAYKEHGLDKPLAIGTVLTIEPGIYIDNDAQVPSEYKNIGIRIEDNVLICADGYKVLSADLPKTISEIETLMANH